LTTTPSPPYALPFGIGASDDSEVWARLAFALGRTVIAVAVWDPEDRLVYANARFRELFAYAGPFDGRPHFETLLARATDGQKPLPGGGGGKRRRDRQASGEFLLPDRRMLRYHDVHTPDGGLVTVYEDVTRQRSAEATLAAVAATIPGAIFELRRNPDGRVVCTYMSERIRELTGSEPDEFTADLSGAVGSLLVGTDIDRIEADLLRSAERLEEWRDELAIRRADGALRWIAAQASPRRLADRTVLWSGVLTDTTAVAESNAALAASERRFRDIIDIASDWVWETDVEGRITFVSERFAELSGFPTDSMIGRKRRELPHYDWNDPGLQGLEEDVRERRPIHGRRLRISTPAGERHIAMRGRPVLDAVGAFLGYRGTGTDVTHEHEYVERLQEAMLEAQSANRAKSRFLANMSHDLRTPLNAIMGFSEVMQAEVFGPVGHPRYAEYIRDIRTSAAHLLELIDDLLDLARIEAGRVEMVEERLEVSDLVDEAMMLVAPRCEARGVTLTKTLSADAPVVRSDRRAVKQILVNLLTNASKFTERGGSIEVRVQSDEIDGVWIAVHDDGCGIPTTMIDEVTKPFVQAGGATSRPRDGVGLGLAIVRSLTDVIGAELRIESRLGEGTTAAFRLPSGRSSRAA